MPERGWRWCRRNPAVAALLAFSVGLLVVIALSSLAAAVWFKDQRDAARNAERDKTQELCRSYLAQSCAGRLTGQAGQSFDGLAAIRRVMGLVGADNLQGDQVLDLRNGAIACLAIRDLRAVHEQSSGMDYDLGGYAFDPLLERYTYADNNDRRLVVRRLADNEMLARLPSPPGLEFWYVTALFSPNGRFLAVNYLAKGLNGLFEVWDLQTDKVVRQIEVTGYPEFRSDSLAVAIGMTDGTMALYQLPDGAEIRRFGQDLYSRHVSFDPGGRRLASSTDGTLQVFEIDSGEETVSFEHPAQVHSTAWSRDGRSLAAGCQDHLIYVYNVEEQRLQAVLAGHQSDVLYVQFSSAGDLLASNSWDNITRLWDPVSGKQWVSMAGTFVRFSADGRRLGFKKDSSFGIWEVADGRVCRTLHHGSVGNRAPWRADGGTHGVDFSADGRLLASAGSDGVRFWDRAAGSEIHHLDTVRSVQSVQFDPRDEGLITYGKAGLFYWPLQAVDPPNSSSSLRVGPPQMWHQPGNTSWPRACWDHDGRFVAFTDHANHRAFVLNRDKPTDEVELKDCNRIISIALSPDGKWAAATAWKDSRVRVWNTATGNPEEPLRDTGPSVHALSTAFSPDNQWLVVGSATGYRWWRVGSWKPGLKIDRSHWEAGGAPLAFARNSPLLGLTVAPQTVRLVHPTTGRELATLTAPDLHVINSLCFSPDGSQLAATMENQVHLWDLRALRRQLADIGLDWDPPLPPRTDQEGDTLPPKVTVTSAI
jgi:WD40 repeat protein